jgi:hypothetical protein
LPIEGFPDRIEGPYIALSILTGYDGIAPEKIDIKKI